MTHTFTEKIAHAERVQNELLPEVEDEHLHAVAVTVVEVGAVLVKQREAVWAARRAGRSWALIAMAMGLSRQLVTRTYGEPPERR